MGVQSVKGREEEAQTTSRWWKLLKDWFLELAQEGIKLELVPEVYERLSWKNEEINIPKSSWMEETTATKETQRSLWWRNIRRVWKYWLKGVFRDGRGKTLISWRGTIVKKKTYKKENKESLRKKINYDRVKNLVDQCRRIRRINYTHTNS